jgi:hypothetical protein
MKTLNIPFEDDDFEKIAKKKPKKMSWQKYLLMKLT